MKKIIITLCLAFASITVFAQRDCSNPTTTYVGLLGTYKCGYSNVVDPPGGPLTWCYQLANGNILAAGTTKCTSLPGAPINSGLIFLIIAGLGLGGYMIYKNQNEKAIGV